MIALTWLWLPKPTVFMLVRRTCQLPRCDGWWGRVFWWERRFVRWRKRQPQWSRGPIIGLVPIFDTTTKALSISARGPGVLAAVRRAVRVPVVAIGGVTLERVPELARAGAAAVAVVSEVLGASDRVERARSLVRAFEDAKRAPKESRVRVVRRLARRGRGCWSLQGSIPLGASRSAGRWRGYLGEWSATGSLRHGDYSSIE